MNEHPPSPAANSEPDALVDEAILLVRGQRHLENDGEATRERLHASHARMSAQRRERRTQLIVALAATFVLSTAFAWYTTSVVKPTTGASARPSRPALAAAADPDAPPVAPTPPAEPSASTNEQQRLSDDVSRVSSSTHEPRRSPRQPDVARRTDAPSAPVTTAAPVLGAPAPITAPTRVSPEQQRALYMTAHQLHFRGAPQAALSAWDAYLATAPGGALAVEARYNRAVVLIRLGRRDAARTALTPFANGEYGSFRRADASVLLKQLE